MEGKVFSWIKRRALSQSASLFVSPRGDLSFARSAFIAAAGGGWEEIRDYEVSARGRNEKIH